MAYDAFISYRRDTDERIARALHSGLQQFARPWNRRRALRVFLDTSSLAASSSLTASITNSLDSSRHLIVVASPQGAESVWVDRELRHWLGQGSATDRLTLVLADGELRWDDVMGDFDVEASTALSPALVGVFADEPLWVDLRSVSQDEHPLELRSNALFNDAVATVAAPIHGRSKEDLAGQDIVEFRRARWFRRAAVVGISAFALIASVAAVIAAVQWNRANAEADRANAEADRTYAGFLAAQSRVEASNGQPELALALAIEAVVAGVDAESSAVDALARARVEVSEPHLVELESPNEGLVAWSPDAELAAIAMADSVRIWDLDAAGFTEQRFEMTAGEIAAIDWSTDGNMLAAANGGTVEVWDIISGDSIDTVAVDGRVEFLAWRPEHCCELAIATSRAPDRAQASLWQVDEDVRNAPTEIARFNASLFTALGWNFTGEHLATAHASDEDLGDGPRNTRSAVRVWEPDGDLVAERWSLDWAWVMEWHPSDAERIAIGWDNGDAEVWDLAHDMVTLDGHDAGVGSLAWTDSNTLLTGGLGGRLLEWKWSELSTDPAPRSLVESGPRIRDLDASVGGVIAVRRGGQIQLWRDDRGAPYQFKIEQGVEVADVEWSKGNGLVAVARSKTGAETGAGRDLVTVFDPADDTWSVSARITIDEATVNSGIAWHPADDVLAVGTKQEGGGSGSLSIVDAAGQQLSLDQSVEGIIALDWSSGGLQLVTGGDRVQLWRWDESSGLEELDSLGSRTSVGDVDWSADGRFIAAGDEFGELTVWSWDANSESATIVKTIAAHTAGIHTVQFSPVESLIATAASDGTVRLWSFDAAENAVDADGTPLIGGGSEVYGLDWSPDGRLLATVDWGGEMGRLWSVENRAPLGAPMEIGNLDVAFSPDGSKLVTAGFDGARVVTILDLDEACSIAAPYVSDDEIARFIPDGRVRESCTNP